MTNFTKEDLNNLQIFLGRVQLTGNEAVVLVLLQQKVAQLSQEEVKEEKPNERKEK